MKNRNAYTRSFRTIEILIIGITKFVVDLDRYQRPMILTKKEDFTQIFLFPMSL